MGSMDQKCVACFHDYDDHLWTPLDDGPWASESFGCAVEGCACKGYTYLVG